MQRGTTLVVIVFPAFMGTGMITITRAGTACGAADIIVVVGGLGVRKCTCRDAGGTQSGGGEACDKKFVEFFHTISFQCEWIMNVSGNSIRW